MHSHAMKSMIALAKSHDGKGKSFTAIAKASTEAGVVVPSVLRKNLEAAGCKVKVEKRKYGCDVQILQRLDNLLTQKHPIAIDYYECKTRDPKREKPDPATMLIVGRAYSHDETDAILQAVFAEMKEESKWAA